MTKVVFKWSKWLSISLISLLVAIAIALAAVLFTTPGLKLVLWGAEKFVPQLKVESYSGAIFPRFTLNGVVFKDDSLNVDVQARSITLAVNAACLTEPSVCVDELAVDGLKFEMPELPQNTATPDEPVAGESGPVTAPVPIKVKRVALTDISLNVLGNQVDWQSFTTGLAFQGNRLRINKTALDSIRVALAPSEASELVPAASPSAEANAPIVLPNITLPLQIDVVRLDVNDFELQQPTPVVVHHLGLEASAARSQVQVDTLELDMPEVEGQLSTTVTLADDYPLDLELNAKVKQEIADGQTVKLHATGSVADLTLKADFGGLAKAHLEAALQPLNAELTFELTLSDGDLQWPLKGQGDYFATIRNLHTQGSLSGYSVELDSALKGKQLPDADLTLRGNGDLNQIDLQSLSIQTLGGEVSGTVMANWQAPINWAANLSLKDIQPGLQWQQAEGNISGKLATTGSLTEQGGWQVELPTLDIDGILRDYPLNIEGALSASDKAGTGEFKIDTPRLVLSHGPNHLTAKGDVEQNLNMQLAVDFPDIAKSVPDVKGSAQGQIKLTGKLDKPLVGVDLNVKAIKWQQDVQVEGVSLQGQISPMPLPSGELQLKVANAKYQDYLIDKVLLNFDGEQQQHALTLDLESNIASTKLAIKGALQDKPELMWKGALERMSLTSEQGTWNLNQPTQLEFLIDSQQAFVAAHCWLQADASICLDQDVNAGQSGEAHLSIKQFDFEQVKAFVPQAIKLEGGVNATAMAKWAPEQAPQVVMKLEMPKGSVKQNNEQPVHLGWESLKLNASLAENSLHADWLFDVADNGDISGELNIPDVLAKDKQIDGRLGLTTFNLDFLAPILGDYSKLKSNIATELTFSGPVMQPKVQGQFVVDDILLKGEITPVEIDSGKLTVNFSGYDATLAAAINTPDGKLEVAGDADWRDLKDWQTNVRVFAEELLVDVPPMAKIKVVPDMTISASPKQARIDGNISLPWGRIVVEELPPSAIGVSKDQVILNDQLEPEQETASVPFSVQTNINIKIGDDFKLSAFGLEGGLSGNLNVAQRDKGPFVTGEVNIVDGSYRSFGQDLLIKQGKILMNGPVDQPYVQITAIRNPDNTQDEVTAGVRVTGPADEPSVTIFSEPAMPQANALSYLLRGQNIDGESGGNSMTTTLIGLSLAQSGRVVGQIGEAFGVQDLQVDTAGSGDDSQVTVSGYVLPGLQVKYGVGIFDSVGEFTVRYRLMQDLYLEAMSGLDSAVDLLYQFEFN
ncbi:translocation/assembly module TamB domain-containing protein [Vibrio coralliilyticus]|uniref:autotransporter assembly complex protein TamB n=1 Tax=Vibrio coralliilyticus TaxID=190893 RepID=UPI0024090F84|nr:translocation/assembly module TamB domain-containing protein [Vibrio coralliilyticus]WFB48458.1 translocation/assembly module TamB [Vibrio coralliilyticus]